MNCLLELQTCKKDVKLAIFQFKVNLYILYTKNSLFRDKLV